MSLAVVYAALFVAFIVIVLLLARWSLRSQERMLREDAEKRREMYDRYR